MNCFNAARGFVCGARLTMLKDNSDTLCFNAARGFVCGASAFAPTKEMAFFSFNAARGFVCGARGEIIKGAAIGLGFQCRTRLCLWCKNDG